MTVRYARHPELRHTALEGEGIVLHLGTRRYFTVSESSLALLEALEAPRTFDELVAVLTDRYDVAPDRAATSVREFLDRCREARLILAEGEG